MTYHPERLSMEKIENAPFDPADRIGQLTICVILILLILVTNWVFILIQVYLQLVMKLCYRNLAKNNLHKIY